MTELLTPLHLIFFAFAGMAALSGIAVITTRNPVHSVLSLVVTFFAMAGVWMILHAEFLSLILLLVYVGAVMTLFLFVVMMLNIDIATKRHTFVRYLPFGILVVLLLTGLVFIAVGPAYFGLKEIPLPMPLPQNYSNIQQVGTVLYTDYVYPFEIAGVILLAAIIAAITLAHRGPTRRKVQHVDKQNDARPENYVRLVKMPSQPKKGGV